MRRKVFGLATVLAVMVGVGGAVAFGSNGEISAPQTIRLDARGGQIAFLFLNPNKRTAFGDQIVVKQAVYTLGTKTRMGSVHAVCTFMDKAGGSADCAGTVFLRDGSIFFSGPVHFEVNDRTVGGITGGSGRYRNARGQVVLINRKSGSEGFLFQLEP
jgi:hypothetical protein